MSRDVILGVDLMAQIRSCEIKYLVENEETHSTRKATSG